MRLTFFLFFILISTFAFAEETKYADVIASGTRQLRLTIDSPRSLDSIPAIETAKEMGNVIAFDLNLSGAITAETKDLPPMPGTTLTGIDFVPWLTDGFDLLVRSEFSIKGDDLTVEFRLFDVLNRKLMISKRYLGKKNDLRRFAHSFADEILLLVDKEGGRGCFTSSIAYVTTQSGNKEIAFMDWDGHNVQTVTQNGSINLNPDFSPDGREIIFSSYKRGNPDLYKKILSSGTELVLSHRKGLNITGEWSPDGMKVALTLSKDGNSEIYTLNKDGGNPVRLTINSAIEVSPAWSPDGTRIAFVSDRLGKPQIFVMNADGSNVRRLTTSGSYNVNPSWSPKGDKIAYARQQRGGFQIYTIKTDGSEDTQLTSSGSNENPAWSPDSRFISFSSKQGGAEAINIMRANGSGQIRVSQSKGGCTQPSWSPR